MKLAGLFPLFFAMAFAAVAQMPSPSPLPALAGLPPALQKVITAQVGGGKLESINQTTEDGEISYTVNSTGKDGWKHPFMVAEDGRVVMPVTLAETPAPVQKTVALQLGKGKLTGVEKSIESGETSYDFDMTGPDGVERGFTVEADGTLSSMEVTLAELPPAAQKTVTGQVADGTLDGVEKIIEDKNVYYEVDRIAKNGQKRSFTVVDDGNMPRIEVTLDETTPAARKTIVDKIGAGKIVRIDKSYMKEKKVLPFKVVGIKDGQPFDFSVGPGGRFLGMDQ